jgi:hypothetical protein
MTVTAGRGQVAKNAVELTASRVAAMGVDWGRCAGDSAGVGSRMGTGTCRFAGCDAMDSLA